MDLNLKNKVYIISGSSKGIGFCIAKCFLEEGAKVIITGRNELNLKQAESDLKEKNEGNILALLGDLKCSTVVKKNVSRAVEYFGRLDGVVANIGSGSEPMGLVNDEEFFKNSYEINVKSAMLLIQESVPYIEKSGGSVTIIGSIAGIEDIEAPLAYSMHKAALVAASKKLSRILAPNNIRVNLIAPGNIFIPDGVWDNKKNKDEKIVLEYINKEVPLNTFGDPEDIGYLSVFLASDKAKFITGSVIVADGGQTKTY